MSVLPGTPTPAEYIPPIPAVPVEPATVTGEELAAAPNTDVLELDPLDVDTPNLPILVDRKSIGAGLTPQSPGVADDLPDPTTRETFGAAFGLENDVVNALDWLSRETFKPDPDFDPMSVIAGTKYEEGYLDNFVGVQSEAEARSVMSRIDREEAQRDILARSGWTGVLAGVSAGVLSPTSLIPVGGWIKAAYGAGRGARTAIKAAEGAALVGGAVALQEGVLQATQETRTMEEFFYAIAGGAILGGILGPFIGRAEWDDLAKRIPEIPATKGEEAAAFDKAVSLGAASVTDARSTGEIKGALGMENVVRFQDPLIRLQTSPFDAARNAVRDLAETPLTLAENAKGIPTSVGGAVETQIKMARAPLAEAITDLDKQFSQYYFGKKVRFAGVRSGVRNVTGRGGGRLSYQDFKREVYNAALAGDVHEIPEVAAAAKAFRAKVFDPAKKAAIDLGIFPEDIKPANDAGYVPRIWNTTKIAARRVEFQGVLKSWFELGQQSAARAVTRLEKEIATLKRVGEGAKSPDGHSVEELQKQLDDHATFARKDPSEIQDIAESVVNRILGNDHSRVMGTKGTVPGLRGALRERTLHIPTSMVREFVEDDIEVVSRIYNRTMATDLSLTKKFGSTDLAEEIRKINDEADGKVRGAKSEKERTKIEGQRKAAIRDVEAIRDRLRGTYKLPTDPQGLAVRAGRVVRNLNYLRLLGGMTISAVPDIARPVMVHGLTRVMGTAFNPLVRGLSSFKLAAKEAKLAGTALDMALDSRAMEIADIMDDYGRGSKMERGLSSATHRFGLVSLMAPWNAAMKQFVGIVAQTRFLEGAEKLAAGKASPKYIEYLAQAGIDRNLAGKIATQFEKHGQKDGAVWWANTGDWTDKAAREAFHAALVRDVDRTIVTPGQDKPLWMSSEMGKILGQFRSFNIASMQRTVLSGLQQRDLAALNGAMLMLGLGAMSYYLKSVVRGNDVPDDPVKWAVEAFDNSGLAGWLMDANNIAEKITRGSVGMAALTGEEASRYASRNALGALLGPTFDLVGDAIQVTGSAASGDWSASDTKAARKMVPLQNLFYIRQLFNAAENGVNEAFGIPMRRKN